MLVKWGERGGEHTNLFGGFYNIISLFGVFYKILVIQYEKYFWKIIKKNLNKFWKLEILKKFTKNVKIVENPNVFYSRRWICPFSPHCLRAPVSSDLDVPKLTYHEKNYNWDGSNEKYISLLQLYENRLKIAIRFPSVLDRFLKFVGRAKIRSSFAHFSKKPLHFREI